MSTTTKCPPGWQDTLPLVVENLFSGGPPGSVANHASAAVGGDIFDVVSRLGDDLADLHAAAEWADFLGHQGRTPVLSAHFTLRGSNSISIDRITSSASSAVRYMGDSTRTCPVMLRTCQKKRSGPPGMSSQWSWSRTRGFTLLSGWRSSVAPIGRRALP